MDQQLRAERLRVDFDALAALAAASTIFGFEPNDQPGDRYTLSFRGAGLARDVTDPSSFTIVHLHQVDLRLPFAYPESPPDIRWLTPIWHPCVSYSGLVDLADIGLVWAGDMPLDRVCERLWDVARAAYFNADRAANVAAENWFASAGDLTLPADNRELRDLEPAVVSNIIHYERRGERPLLRACPRSSGEVLFIDENTPTPELPARQPYVPINRRRAGDEDVLYIGPE